MQRDISTSDSHRLYQNNEIGASTGAISPFERRGAQKGTHIYKKSTTTPPKEYNLPYRVLPDPNAPTSDNSTLPDQSLSESEGDDTQPHLEVAAFKERRKRHQALAFCIGTAVSAVALGPLVVAVPSVLLGVALTSVGAGKACHILTQRVGRERQRRLEKRLKKSSSDHKGSGVD